MSRVQNLRPRGNLNLSNCGEYQISLVHLEFSLLIGSLMEKVLFLMPTSLATTWQQYNVVENG